MDLGLKGKVALVTGGARGLGKTICELFAAEGAKVAACDLADAKAVADGLTRTYGVQALAVKADITSEADVARMFDEIEKTLGPVDALVNNTAVVSNGGPMTNITEKEWSRMFQVNMGGTFLCSREHIRRLLTAKRTGKIVNISSQAAFRGSESGKLAYDASKGAIVSFTIALAREMAPYGINVNSVAPGLMRTEMLAALIDANPGKFNNRVPLKRVGKTEEIGAVVVFLCSERASYMTGATVDVSGGLAMH
ncbi:MAG: SDR family oxidoreductase [Planctomycetota bacterium]|nr:SDR family oxidoreductase [Planctomycetota bacterium]